MMLNYISVILTLMLYRHSYSWIWMLLLSGLIVLKFCKIYCSSYWKSAKTIRQDFDCFNWRHSFESGQICAISRCSYWFHIIMATSCCFGVRFRISSMLHSGTLPTLLLCLLYSTFVLPLFDYCDVVWTPTTAKLTAMLGRVHSKFVRRLLSSFHPKFSYVYSYRTSKVS